MRNETIDNLALGQVYEIVAKVDPKNEAYECLRLTPFESGVDKLLGLGLELGPAIYNLFVSWFVWPLLFSDI